MIKNVYFLCVPNNPTDFVIRLIKKKQTANKSVLIIFPPLEMYDIKN